VASAEDRARLYATVSTGTGVLKLFTIGGTALAVDGTVQGVSEGVAGGTCEVIVTGDFTELALGEQSLVVFLSDSPPNAPSRAVSNLLRLQVRLVEGVANYVARPSKVTRRWSNRHLDTGSPGVSDVAFSADGRSVAAITTNRRLLLMDPATGGTTLLSSSAPADNARLAFSPDGALVAAWNDSKGTVTLISTQSRALVGEVRLDGGRRVHDVAFIPSTSTLAILGMKVSRSGFGSLWDPGTAVLLLWDVARQKAISSVAAGDERSIGGFVYSADGRALLTWGYAGGGDEVRFWSPETGSALGPSLEYSRAFANEYVRSLERAWFIRDATRFVVLSGDLRFLTTWDVQTRTNEKKSRISPQRGPLLEVTRDGLIVALGGTEGTVVLWDVDAGAAVAELTDHPDGVVKAVFSEDGSAIATGTARHLTIWSVPSGERRAECMIDGPGITRNNWRITVRPDGRGVAVGRRDTGQVTVCTEDDQ
jgi:WD40 repeat protein